MRLRNTGRPAGGPDGADLSYGCYAEREPVRCLVCRLSFGEQ